MKSMKKVNAREIALIVLNEVYNKGAYANIALAEEIARQDLSDQDRRFVTELVYGTVKQGAVLDWILAKYLTRSMEKLPPVIRNILRMGIYQITGMDKVPVSAACNQAVELAKKYGHPGTVKFVNAVLRSAVRLPEKAAYPDPESQPVRYLALKYYHPEWLIERWLKRLSYVEVVALCEANNQTPPLSIRTNTLKITRPELLDVLAAEGVEAEPSELVPEEIVCCSYPALGRLESLQQGLFQIQDESSMLVGHVLGPLPGEFIIDACGAPGGKSTHIAALMQNKGKVLSTDIHEHKLKLTRENAIRLGIVIIETLAADAADLHLKYKNQADRVLVDAPCSGIGVIRRKPDSRWRKSPEVIRDLPDLQLSILKSAAECVKPGGVLVYSTCTTEPEENNAVIESFLQARQDYYLQPAGEYLPLKRLGNMIQLWPHKDAVDGFFIARLKRGAEVRGETI